MKTSRNYVYFTVREAMQAVYNDKPAMANALYELSGMGAYQNITRLDRESLTETSQVARKKLVQKLSDKEMLELFQKLGMFMVGNGI